MASGSQMLVSIQYLRTYLNAGRVKVYVCGQSSDEPFGVIDALWEYPLRQVSIPQYFMKSFRPEDLNKSKCLAFLQKYHSFTSISPVSSSNSGDTKPFILSENNSNLEPVPSIIIEHEVITRFHHRGFFEQTSRTYKQKVKISSIQLCKKDE